MHSTLYLRALPLPTDTLQKKRLASYFLALDLELDKRGVNLGIMERSDFGYEPDLGRVLKDASKGLSEEEVAKTLTLPFRENRESNRRAMFWPRDVFLVLDDITYISPEYQDVSPLILEQLPGMLHAEISLLGEGGLSIFAKDVILYSAEERMDAITPQMRRHFNHVYPLPYPTNQSNANYHIDTHASLLDLDSGLMLTVHDSLYRPYKEYFHKLRTRLGLNLQVIDQPIEEQPLNIVQLPKRQIMLPSDSCLIEILREYHDMNKVLAIPDTLGICNVIGGFRCATNVILSEKNIWL